MFDSRSLGVVIAATVVVTILGLLGGTAWIIWTLISKGSLWLLLLGGIAVFVGILGLLWLGKFKAFNP